MALNVLPEGRPYADLEKAAPRILPKDLHQACMNRLPVRSVVAGQRMAPVKQNGQSSSIASQLLRKYIWDAVRTAKSPTFPATSNDGQSRAVSGEHRKPRMPEVR